MLGHRHHQLPELLKQQSVTYPKLRVTPSCFHKESTQRRKQHQNWLQLRVRHEQAFRKLQRLCPIHSFRRLLLPIESTDSTMTIPDCGKRKKRQDDATIIDRWLQPTAFRSWTISFKSEVCHSSQHPRAAVLSKSIDDLITSASVTGRPIPDFENLDFKIVQADSGRS